MKTNDDKHLNELINEYKSLVDGPTDDCQRRQREDERSRHEIRGEEES